MSGDSAFPRLDILPLKQRRLWDQMSDIPEIFTLFGDTALALHLGHRESVDFDFFGIHIVLFRNCFEATSNS